MEKPEDFCWKSLRIAFVCGGEPGKRLRVVVRDCDLHRDALKAFSAWLVTAAAWVEAGGKEERRG